MREYQSKSIYLYVGIVGFVDNIISLNLCLFPAPRLVSRVFPNWILLFFFLLIP